MPRRWDALNAWLSSAYCNILCVYMAPCSWYSPFAIHVCWKHVSYAAIKPPAQAAVPLSALARSWTCQPVPWNKAFNSKHILLGKPETLRSSLTA